MRTMSEHEASYFPIPWDDSSESCEKRKPPISAKLSSFVWKDVIILLLIIANIVLAVAVLRLRISTLHGDLSASLSTSLSAYSSPFPLTSNLTFPSSPA